MKYFFSNLSFSLSHLLQIFTCFLSYFLYHLITLSLSLFHFFCPFVHFNVCAHISPSSYIFFYFFHPNPTNSPPIFPQIPTPSISLPSPSLSPLHLSFSLSSSLILSPFPISLSLSPAHISFSSSLSLFVPPSILFSSFHLPFSSKMVIRLSCPLKLPSLFFSFAPLFLSYYVSLFYLKSKVYVPFP